MPHNLCGEPSVPDTFFSVGGGYDSTQANNVYLSFHWNFDADLSGILARAAAPPPR